MDIYKKIDRANIVTFDIFDTLIKRNVEKPEDVFKLVEAHYNLHNKNSIKKFTEYRIKAEREARIKSIKEEVSLDEIYNVLKSIYPYYNESLKKLEIECEKNICTLNYDVYKMYKYALDNNKDIYIISDFYLEKKILKEILAKNKIINYKALVVSCDIGLTKKSGNLFKEIIKLYNIDKDKMLHIGDHPLSDNKIPKQLKIDTYKIFNNQHKISYKIKNKIKKSNNEISENIINEFVKNNLNAKAKDINYSFGYEKLGILYYGLLQKINDVAKEIKAERIYFFSRDGYILKQAYDKTFSNDSNIETSYFYISRRAIVVPSLVEDYELDKLVQILGIRDKDTIKSFFKRIGLNIDYYNEELNQCGLKHESNFVENDNVRKLYKLIRKDIVNNAQKELKILQKYLEQEKMNSIKRCIVVDIGWRGSIQYSLENIFRKLNYNVEINGVYLGLNKKSEIFLKEGMNVQGYLFSKENNYDTEAELSAGVGLVESLFLANHGTVLGYHETNNIITPILAEYEYSEKDKIIISGIQNAAIDFVNDFYNFNKNLNLTINEMLAFKKLKKFIKQPDKKYLRVFGDLNFSDYSDGNLAKPKSIKEYILKPKELKKDFLNSQWKIGFMKRIVKIKLPYYTIYKILREKFSS